MTEIDTCAKALQRAANAAVDLRGRLAEAETDAIVWRMYLGEALAEAAGEVYLPSQIVIHPSTGPKPFVVRHFSATLPPQLILVCWPVRITDWADKVHGDEHHFPASECTVIGMRGWGCRCRTRSPRCAPSVDAGPRTAPSP